MAHVLDSCLRASCRGNAVFQLPRPRTRTTLHHSHDPTSLDRRVHLDHSRAHTQSRDRTICRKFLQIDNLTAFEYVLVAPVDSFASYDGPSPMEKGLGAQGFAAWQAKAGSLVSSVRRFIIRTRPDLSFQAKRTGPPKLAVVTEVHVAPNRNLDFENYVKNDYLPVMKQANVSYLVSQSIFGGDANSYIALTLRESFADLDKGPVVNQVLGAEGAMKLAQKLPTGTVINFERSLARFVPELSFMPPE